MSKEERLSISTEVLNTLLNVLAQRPYAEVANIITEAQQDVRPIVSQVEPELEKANAK